MAGVTGVGGAHDSAAYLAQLHEVYRLSDALHRTTTPEAFHRLAVDGVLKATGASRAAILLLDPAGVMRFQAWSGLSEAYRKAVEGHNPWTLDVRDPQPVLVADVGAAASLQDLLPVVRSEGIGALAFVPILCDTRLAGKFMIYHDTPHCFESAETEIACAVAHHVGFALERRQAENRLRDERQLFVDGPVVVFKWRAAHGWPIEFVSANVRALTGHDQDDWLSGRVSFKALMHSDDALRVRSEIWDRIRTRTSHFEQEYRIVRADGAVRWVRDFTRVVRDDADVPVYFHGYLQDVTSVKCNEAKLRELTIDLESHVAERTSALEEACRELEAFTYSVSHDLRAPLRWIDSYSVLLAEAIGPAVDAESAMLFEKIRSATRRMATLVDDLLALSRISQQAMMRRRVDLSQMAADVVGAIHEADPARAVVWSIESGLRTDADPGLVRVLLENLLGNAWKFTSLTAPAHIRFGLSEGGSGNWFEVADNGAGFDMRYVGNLFEPFQRLHSVDQFPGSGIGLATVARIVRRHGGIIRAEAAPGAGARFRFTLGATALNP